MNKSNTLAQKIIKIMFRLLTILSVDLLVNLLNTQIMHLDHIWSKPIVTLVGMNFVIILFYFLLEYIDRLTIFVLKMTVGVGNLVKFKKTAIILIMLAIFYGQYLCYYRIWFGSWPVFPWKL